MRVEHIAIYVKDLDKSRTFYEKYFNAKSNELYHNKTRDFKSYFLSFESGARLELMNLPVLEDASENIKRYGIIHIAFSVGSEQKVRDLTEEIRLAGYEIVSEPHVTGDGYYESTVKDNEGNLVEITV